jgi:WD40 repeat protein
MENNKDINEEKLQDISIEEIDEEENDYEDDYLVDDDEIEKEMNNLDEIQEKNENDMEIEINIEEKIHTEFPDVVTQGEIYSIAMNSHGFIVVGDGEDTTYFIDGNTKQIVKQEKTNKDSVNCVAFSSCEKYLATASLDGSCNIYETENYTILNTVNGSFSEINVYLMFNLV